MKGEAMNSTKEQKLARIHAAASHREADRIPVGESFWTGFLKKLDAYHGHSIDPYRQFDLDYLMVIPNMDPAIRRFEIQKAGKEDIRIKTGFGATLLRRGDIPMPHYEAFAVTSAAQLKDFAFDPPRDPRRLYGAGDDQINCVGDTLLRSIPCWNARLDSYCDDFPVFGGICEAYEYVWRITGTENALCWMLTEENAFGDFVECVGDFLVGLTEYQISEARGRLAGVCIYGDVAYTNGMLFSPEKWREMFAPVTKRLIDTIHAAGLLAYYHGCGNAYPIFDDLAAMGLDFYNPLEAKAGLDVVELKKEYAGRMAFAGNIDVRALESGNRKQIKKEVLYKLQAGAGGGWMCASDHSISSFVEPQSYEYMVGLLREYGSLPLDTERLKAELEALER